MTTSTLLDALLAQAVENQSAAGRVWTPLPHQLPPPGEPGIDWYIWLLFGGRGTGKTDGCAHFMNEHALGPPCLSGSVPHRMAIVAPTLGDASEACVNGPSGLRAHNPDIRETTRKGGTFVNWPNGAEAKLFGAYTREEPERLRAGGNRCFAWLEEVAAWRYLAKCWQHVNLGLLRLGDRPHAVASTTPRNRPTVKEILAMAEATNSVTRGTTADNPHLPQQRRDALYSTYAGTRVGRQELEGELIEDVVGALWSDELIELAGRVKIEDAPQQQRLVIAVDPSWGTTNDEVGIVAGFKGSDGHAYILEDLSGRYTPSEWGVVVVQAYERLAADKVIGEGNFQAEQVKLAMRVAAMETGITVHFGLVYASRGKALRAEPVVALYEQQRVHHIRGANLMGLEFQMTHWVPPRNDPDRDRKDGGDPEPERNDDAETSDDAQPSEYSPDRVDALVFLVTELLLSGSGEAKLSVAQGRIDYGAAAGRAATDPTRALPPHLRRLHQQTRRS